ncbi:NADP-dependent oxidoreductase [Sphingomonas sp. RB3P16]|uniref:NADP-dependent oxidoreductase n=1 Tax=Parasphingomonas frigoris TaxID=3096163 RepID=UPI002FC77110
MPDPSAPMLAPRVRQIVLLRRPTGVPEESCFGHREIAMPEPAAGQMLVRMRVASLDPAIRGFLDDRPSYLPPVEIGAPVTGMSLGEIVVSRHEDWPVGTLVRVLGSWSDHFVITPDALGLERVVPVGTVPLRAYMGALGPVGLTAWVGLFAVAAAKAGDTILVSAAAGATGSTVVQLAKAAGCRVVGIAGGAEKVALVRALGADAVIDHRAWADLGAALDAAAPEGFDGYFDNIGGPTLDAVLPRMREQGRIAVCGMIAQYNDADHPHGVTTLWQLVVRRLKMQGFLTYDYVDRLGEAQAMLDRLHAQGRLRLIETVHHGFDSLPHAFIDLMQGRTTGKTLVELDATR